MDRAPEIDDQLRFLLSKGRIRDALALLNSLTSYRFTALFRFADPGLDNLVLFDRTNDGAPRLESIPVGDSYCTYVRDLHDAFVVEDSLDDVRVERHPKRQTVHSCCGVPLVDANGRMFGTICHFDFDAVPGSDDSVALLREVAAYLDPRQVERTAAGEVEIRIDALRGMLALLLETSTSDQEAIEAFEEYARPLRASQQDIGASGHARIAERIDALLAEFSAMSRQRSTPQ